MENMVDKAKVNLLENGKGVTFLERVEGNKESHGLQVSRLMDCDRWVCPACHLSQDFSHWDTKVSDNRFVCPSCGAIVHGTKVELLATEHNLNTYGAGKMEHKINWFNGTQYGPSDMDILLMGVTFIPYEMAKEPGVVRSVNLKETHSNGTHIASIVYRVEFPRRPAYFYGVASIHVRRDGTKLMMLTDFDMAMDFDEDRLYTDLDAAINRASRAPKCEYIEVRG